VRGRVPRTREERIRQGATRALPEPVRVSGKADLAEVLDLPTELGEAATTWYRDVATELAEAGVIERVDTHLLAMAAAAYGDFVTAEAIRRKKGGYAIGSTGQVVLAPWMKQRRDAMLVFERLVNHFPLSPVARARLGLAGLQAVSMARALEHELGPIAEDEFVIDADAVVGVPGL
jgi:P27 family predicted phage terminase small subunit